MINKWRSLDLSLQLLVVDLLLLGVLGDGLEVSIDVADPLAGVGLALAHDLLLGRSESSLLGETGSAGGPSLLIGPACGFADEAGVGVHSVKGLGVVEGIVLGGGVKHAVGLGGADCRLDLVGVDDAGDVGIGDLAVGESVSLLLSRGLSLAAEDAVQLLEGALSPDDETADVASGGELEQVESADVSDFNAGDVAERLDEGHIGTAVDNERSSARAVSSVSQLSLSGAHLDGVDDLLDIGPGTGVSEEPDGFLGAFDFLGGVADDEGEFGEVVDSVSAGLDEGENGGGCDGSGNGVSLLLEVASSVPSPPDADGGEHASLAAHVTEGTLAVSAGSRSSHSGNTRDGATSSPGLGGVLHTGLVVDRVALASVLGDVGVHEVDDVGPDSGGEDCGEDEVGSSALNDGLALGAGGIVDVDNLSVDHGEKYYIK